MSIKENKPIEYYGYAIPKKRYYSLDSIFDENNNYNIVIYNIKLDIIKFTL